MARLNDLIRCEDAIKEICKRTCTPGVFCPDAYCKEVKEWITDDMVVDAVPRGAYDQVVGERNVAVEQLRQLGYELGEKVTPVVMCKDCRYFGMLKVSPLSNAMCLKHTFTHTPDEFCSRGEWKKEGKQA